MSRLTEAERYALRVAVEVAHGVHAPRGISDMTGVQSSLDVAVEDIVARHVKAALIDAAEDVRANAARAWGGDRSWYTTGTHVAHLAADWVADLADPHP